MVSTELKVKVRIETDVIMDCGLMAKAFAHMASDEQAQFLKLVYQEMGKYERDGEPMGDFGRELQLCYLGDELKKPEYEEAAQMVHELFGFGIDESEDKFELKYSIESEYGVCPPDEFVHFKGVVMEGDLEPMFKPGDLVTTLGFDGDREHYIIEKLGIVETNVEYPGLGNPLGSLGASGISQPRITCKLKPGRKPYSLNEVVKVDGHLVGRMIHIDSDGTIEVLMDQDYGQGGKVYDKPCAALPKCDCGARPGEMHKIQCARRKKLVEAGVDVTPWIPRDNDPKSGVGEPSAREAFRQEWENSYKATVCDECKGTGFYTGLNESTPCSKGCKPA